MMAQVSTVYEKSWPMHVKNNPLFYFLNQSHLIYILLSLSAVGSITDSQELAQVPGFNSQCDGGICTLQFNASKRVLHNMLAYTEAMFDEFRSGPEINNTDLKHFLTQVGILEEGKTQEEESDLYSFYDDYDESFLYADNYTDPDVVLNSLCLASENDAMQEHTGEKEAELKLTDFWLLLPRFLYDLSQEDCAKPVHDHGSHASSPSSEDRGKVWGIAIGSVALISLLSVIGIMIVPLMKHSVYFHRLLSFLVALAVGTLIGDGLLHLLPHAMAGGHEGHDHSIEGVVEEEQKKVMKCLVAVIGIYVFFVFESVMGLIRKRKQKKRKPVSSPSDLTVVSPVKSYGDFVSSEPDVKVTLLQPSKIDAAMSNYDDGVILESRDSGFPSARSCDHKVCEASGKANCGVLEESVVVPEIKIVIDEANQHDQHHHGHHHHHPDLAADSGIKDMAWMIVMGDGLHNFSDGLAIGAAFSSSIPAGLSTSLAIFCHELPHELGDFAVLINAGMSIKQALLYNGMCACLAFFGVIIGMVIGEYTTSVKLWILAVTAGGFLYVALVDMLPQMLESSLKKDGLFCFAYQNVGFVMGISIMLLIALYEGSFQTVFGLSGHAH